MPTAAVRHFSEVSNESYEGIVIRSVFWPDRGWRRHPIRRRRLTRAEMRRLRDDGATHVELSFNGCNADFAIRELLGGKVGS